MPLRFFSFTACCFHPLYIFSNKLQIFTYDKLPNSICQSYQFEFLCLAPAKCGAFWLAVFASAQNWTSTNIYPFLVQDLFTWFCLKDVHKSIFFFLNVSMKQELVYEDSIFLIHSLSAFYIISYSWDWILCEYLDFNLKALTHVCNLHTRCTHLSFRYFPFWYVAFYSWFDWSIKELVYCPLLLGYKKPFWEKI